MTTSAVLRLNVATCPTCQLAIYPVTGAIKIEAQIGTYTSHGHVVCPCGWWTEAKDGEEAFRRVDEHVTWHFDGGEHGEQ